MKLLLLVATVCYVDADKTLRLLAAVAGTNRGMMGDMNGRLAIVAVPGTMAGGLNPSMVAGGGAGFLGQPQLAQFVPGLPAFALPASVPNVYPVPAVNVIGVPQAVPMNPLQQPLGTTGSIVQQPLQPYPPRRFRRQIMQQDNTFKTTVDTQIPAPTETATTTRCDKGRNEDN